MTISISSLHRLTEVIQFSCNKLRLLSATWLISVVVNHSRTSKQLYDQLYDSYAWFLHHLRQIVKVFFPAVIDNQWCKWNKWIKLSLESITRKKRTLLKLPILAYSLGRSLVQRSCRNVDKQNETAYFEAAYTPNWMPGETKVTFFTRSHCSRISLLKRLGKFTSKRFLKKFYLHDNQITE